MAAVIQTMFVRHSLEPLCGFLAEFAATGLATLATAEIDVRKSEHGATITIDGKPFAEYRIRSGQQPVISPKIGLHGQPMTHPLGTKLPTDKDDHPHHQSFWFNHGLVNGMDSWTESPQEGPRSRAHQFAHWGSSEIESGDQRRLVTHYAQRLEERRRKSV